MLVVGLPGRRHRGGDERLLDGDALVGAPVVEDARAETAPRVELLDRRVGAVDQPRPGVEEGMTARAYSRDMMLTTDAGLTVRTEDGAEFQITIVQTKRGSAPAASDENDEGDEN